MSHGIGAGLAPLLLRIALGVTLLWAGWNKVFNTMPISGEPAAILANMGALSPDQPQMPTPAPQGAPATPTTPTTPTTSPTTPTTPAPENRPAPREPLPGGAAAEGPRMHLAAWQAQTYTAADFQQERKVLVLYGLAVMLKQKANPAADAEGKTPLALWPKWAAEGRLPVYFAWAAALTELLGGALLLFGLLTRLAGFLAAGVMGTAMWLTKIGPAIQSGKGRLGFLPPEGFWEKDLANGFVWDTFFWQLALLSMALAVMLLGAGYLSFDKLLGRPASPPPPVRRAPAPDAD